MNRQEPVAHVTLREGTPLYHALPEHLRCTAEIAASFAESFGSGSWAFLAGLWHDLGKYRGSFQEKLFRAVDTDAHIEGRDSRVSHSHAGAQRAIDQLGPGPGSLLAMLIAGHHAGLPDRHSGDGGNSSLASRLASAMARDECRDVAGASIPAEILEPAIGPIVAPPVGAEGYALWLRMLFSCLVDADFLDSERFFSPQRFAQRGRFPDIAGLRAAYTRHMDRLASNAAAGSTVNQQRANVLAQCLNKGRDRTLAPGFFRLTVPTGGGKTLASLGFALEHALAHGKRRIVYAIPYTSIIEQTANVFRGVFAPLGDDIVLEHHCNLDVDERNENHISRIATDNWDAPLIVTTNVQLFESLHAARPSRCRKLHNLAGSIIVLDEAQMLPREFLSPVLRVLKLLVAQYGVSVVLCTATQPMLSSRRSPVGRHTLLDGIDIAHDLIEDSSCLFTALDRVHFNWPADLRTETSWETLATEIRRHDCVLVIVNRRRDARELHAQLADPDAVHLSALMCAEHRSSTIGQIRQRLRMRRACGDTRPLRVISTSLVEAGVDLDFPVVFRALAGLDAIAQAAGRCNREGGLPHKGQMYVFVPPGALPPGTLKQGAQVTSAMVKTGRTGARLLPGHFDEYFDRYYGQDDKYDVQGISELLKPDRSALRTAAERFRLIDDKGQSVIVPYRPEGKDDSPVAGWLGALQADDTASWARRKLQRYTVTVPESEWEKLVRHGDIEERCGLWVALPVRYDSTLGLLPSGDHGPEEGYFA